MNRRHIRFRGAIGTAWGLLALLCWSSDTRAQEITQTSALPPVAAEEILALVNDPGTLQFQGDATIPADRVVQGPVALLGGLLVLNGTVQGDVIVFNGDLTLGPQARITGDVVIVGGRLEPEDGDGIQGFVGIYDRAFPVVQQEGQWVPRGSLRRDRPGLSLGRSRLTLRAGRGYNRVEGLPILFGPVIRTPGTYPLRMEALATFRTETFSLDELGYWFRLEQSFGGPARPRLGLMAYSEVQPMEERGVSDLESSITTLILHRDLRDYFQNEGWGVYVDMERTDFPLTARLSFRQEDHFPVEPGDPLTIFRRDRLWRPMPLAAQGEITSLALDMELDDRNNPDDPTDGWYVKASVMRGLNGELEVPGTSLSPLGPTIQGPTFLPEDIALGSLDVRRYARVDPDSDLRLRLFVGGSINGNPLPPQYQQTLGGVGSLPGFERFTLDCGARSAPVFVQNEEGQIRSTFTGYGCDRTVLFQAQYREEFSFGLDLSSDGESDWDDWRWWPQVDLSLAWVLFFDAGRGWSFSDAGIDSDTLADAGAGIQLGDLGFYVAYPFYGENRDLALSVRLQHRF